MQGWISERSKAYCGYNSTRLIEPNKLKCQNMCEARPDCIGVSNANDGPYANLCYICLDDNLLLDKYGFNFYRKPGIEYVRNKLDHKCFYMMKIKV